MLGDMVAEERGKITGMRVMPSDGAPKVEVSFQAMGKILGLEATDMGTYVSVGMSGGTMYGEGQGVLMSKDGDVATWKGNGTGRFTGKGTAANWRGVVYYQTASPKLARLNGMCAIFEHNVDEKGDLHTKAWEWK